MSHPQLPPTEFMELARKKCLDIAEKLNIEECRYLLQNWLLSLLMCDVSIFVLLKKTRIINNAVDHSNVVKVSNGTAKSHLSFELRVIDTDRKPSSKIPPKREKEKAFDRIFFPT
jgi:inositol-pentakisphosphate 2-kinase